MLAVEMALLHNKMSIVNQKEKISEPLFILLVLSTVPPALETYWPEMLSYGSGYSFLIIFFVVITAKIQTALHFYT